MSWERFRLEVDEVGVATLTLSRPDTLNSLTFEVYADLARLTNELIGDRDVKALVLAGEGRGFCSGGNIDEIMGPLLERDMEGALQFTRMTCEVVRNVRRMPQPVVAAVHGTAAGAGAVLALASDLRVVGDGVKFHFLFTKVGLTGADMGTAWLLPRVIGHGRAMQALLFGDAIPSDRALDWGLANAVVPRDEVLATARSWARRLATGPQEAIRTTKQAIHAEAEMSLEAALEYEQTLQAALLSTADHREFYEAHHEDRDPRWRR
jgi:enoyl-CoA hydratase/carnithine racemase